MARDSTSIARADLRGLRVPALVDPGLRAGARVLLARAGRARVPRGDGAAGGRALRRARAPTTAGCRRSATRARTSSRRARAATRSPTRPCAASSRMIIGEERAVDELWAAAGGADAGAARGPAGPARLHDRPRRRRRATRACGAATRRRPRAAAAGLRRRARARARHRPARARRGRLPLARPQPDRGRPLVALARGRRDPASRPRPRRGRRPPCRSSRSGSTPRRAGAGYAKRGLRDLCRLLLDSTPVVTLFVRTDNLPAIRLYDSIGMQRVLSYRSILFP